MISSVRELFGELIDSLTESAVDALRQKRYDESQKLTQIVRSLEEKQEEVVDLIGGSSSSDASEESTTKVASKPGEEETRGVASASHFPRLFKRKNFLVKQALRSDGKTTYEQKMPKENYLAILDRLRTTRSRKREFHATELQEQNGVPNYHLYMTLALLQQTGHLDVPQRGLYRFQKAQEEPWAASVWEETPNEPY